MDETLDLISELETNLGDINKLIAAVGRDSAKLGIRPEDLLDRNGLRLLAPLVNAKATTLLSLTMLTKQ